MKQIFNIYKPLGKTPLQVVEEFRKWYPEFVNEKIGYAGRLDPMADGVLLLLIGTENKRKKEYEELTKEYTTEILIGVSTDTYDQLGIVTQLSESKNIDQLLIKHYTKGFIGIHLQPYPPYSSQPVNGRPLFYWARENKLSEIKIPTKKIEIFSAEILDFQKKSLKLIIQQINSNIAKVAGDFRQAKIGQTWTKLPIEDKNDLFPLVKVKISCSSGTYIRSFAHKLGTKLQTGAIALSITRTKVGHYTLEESIRL